MCQSQTHTYTLYTFTQSHSFISFHKIINTIPFVGGIYFSFTEFIENWDVCALCVCAWDELEYIHIIIILSYVQFNWIDIWHVPYAGLLCIDLYININISLHNVHTPTHTRSPSPHIHIQFTQSNQSTKWNGWMNWEQKMKWNDWIWCIHIIFVIV